jgi:hypothetical protein
LIAKISFYRKSLKKFTRSIDNILFLPTQLKTKYRTSRQTYCNKIRPAWASFKNPDELEIGRMSFLWKLHTWYWTQVCNSISCWEEVSRPNLLRFHVEEAGASPQKGPLWAIIERSHTIFTIPQLPGWFYFI